MGVADVAEPTYLSASVPHTEEFSRRLIEKIRLPASIGATHYLT